MMPVGHCSARELECCRHLKRCIPVAGALLVCCATSANAEVTIAVHMASHIALMNFVAPIVALAALRLLPSQLRLVLCRGGMLLSATASQIALIWAVHTPTLLAFAISSASFHLVLQGLLLIVALWFWGSIFAQPFHHFWRSLLGLLLTGKLFCLLGALLVFAPRALYPFHSHGAHSSLLAGSAAIEDQQLAGLLMLLACPLSYLLAGVVISSRALRALDGYDHTVELPATFGRQG